jgi:hypothetical protein
MEKINWLGLPGDIIAFSGKYVLNIQQMNRFNWWYSVGFDGVEIESHNHLSKSLAKRSAIKIMNKHIKEHE